MPFLSLIANASLSPVFHPKKRRFPALAEKPPLHALIQFAFFFDQRLIAAVLLLDANALERRFRLAALRSERAELYHLRATREISNETLQKLLHDLDLLEALLIEENQ